MIKFNPETHILGKLCNHGHDYEGTGLSVRLKNGNHGCVECLKQYRSDNIGKISEREKQYRSENKDKIKEYKKRYWPKNKDKVNERFRQYWSGNKDKIKEQKKKYRSKNKDKIKEHNKQYLSENISTLSDNYVKKGLRQQTGIPYAEIPQELIEIKRTAITIHRMEKQILKEIKNGTN